MTAQPFEAHIREAPPACDRAVAAGLSLAATADELVAKGPAADRSAGNVAALLAAGHRLSLRLDLSCAGGNAAGRLVAACGRLARHIGAAGADAANLDLALDVSAVSPRLAWLARDSMLGPGRVSFMIGPRDLAAPGGRRAGHGRRWFELWHLRDEAARTAFRREVRSACALLPPEAADAVLPPWALQAPGESAWLQYCLDLDEPCDGAGRPDTEALCRRIREMLDDAALGFDETRWASARQAEDAWLNRRVAIHVNGIGNLVRRLGLDPACPQTFVELDALLTAIRSAAFESARERASVRNPLPAVAVLDPCRYFVRDEVRAAWEERWRRHVEASAIAHRNLLVMSPWTLFPHDDACIRYAKLLPLLRHADACAFDRRPSLAAWSVDEYVDFHRRAWALFERMAAGTVVAEQP